MIRTTVVAAALALAVTLPAAPAWAQSIRTFVSSGGTDNATCSLAAPCRHFSAAVAATSVGGEVDALDAGAYGSFTISQAISIDGQGWSYVAPGANGNAITVSAGSGDVNIRGVSLNGIGVSNSAGIMFLSGTTLNVQSSVIRNFSAGIIFETSSSSASQILVSNTLVSDNGSDGISIQSTGSGPVTGALDRVEIENNGANNAGTGLLITNTGQNINMTVSDSVFANNNGNGIALQQDNGSTAPVNVMVRNATIVNNSAEGVSANGPGVTIRVTRSTITGNGVGWLAENSGLVGSYGDNNIDTNLTGGNTAPPALSPALVYK